MNIVVNIGMEYKFTLDMGGALKVIHMALGGALKVIHMARRYC